MKMHSPRFKDPLISQARPITLLSPVIEETLRHSGVRPDRELVLEHFMSGAPRIAVVHGSEDHPPSIGSRETARRLIRQLWFDGALPFEVSQSMPCEELSRGLPGSHYAFLARNVCAANLATVMEAHGYDAAIVLGVCDKMLVGSLRALIEADLARQRRKIRPVYAAFVPTPVGREVHLGGAERGKFESFRGRLTEAEAAELFSLLVLPIKPQVYEAVKACLDHLFQKRTILESEKDELERLVARAAAASGANCVSSDASIVNRLMIATFGLVPRHMDLSLKPPSDDQLAHVVQRILQGIQKRERRISASHLTRTNLQNGITVWGATGGHPTWLLHLHYLAEALGVRLSPTALSRKMAKVPKLLSFDDNAGLSAHALAAEADSGGNDGIDTVMRTLSEKRFVDDRSATLDGSWMQRIMDARSANGNFFHSTMTPISPSSGLARVHGNLCTMGLARLGSLNGNLDRYDRKIYLSDYYLGQEELLAELTSEGGVLERLRKKVTRDDLYWTWRINWAASDSGELAQWSKRRLWEYLLAEDLLRVILFVAGEGPRASGMPEIRVSGPAAESIGGGVVLATDGRVSFGHTGMSIAHIVPEAIHGGGLSAIRAGDWIYLNLLKGQFQIVTRLKKAGGYRVLSERELAKRVDSKKRIHELERRRAQFLPSVRSVLDTVGSADEGVSPLG